MALVNFESPSTWIISGMTGSGKSTLLYKLLKCKNIMFDEPPKKNYILLFCLDKTV